jgi:glycosyltransferase involved in cell wall biosynthesis
MTKLLSVNSYHYRRGGADVVYFEHDALFREIGWDTAFFAMHHPLNIPSEWAEYFVDELQYGHAYSLPQKVGMAAKIIYSQEARDKLRKLLSRFRPDVAHAHNLYHHISPSVLPLLREEGIPVVLTAHDLKLCCPSHQMLNHLGLCERCKGGNFLHAVRLRCVHGSLSVSALVALESALHRWSAIYRRNLNRIVVPSLFYKRKFEEWGWSSEQVTFIPNFVTIQKLAPVPEPGHYFLYFGRLSIEKGLGTLLNAFRHIDARLVVAGDGELGSEVEAAAAETRGRISWLGRRSGDDLLDVVARARAVIVPSEWYENAPMSILESYALGKPVIGADIGGIPELVKEGETGLLFPAGSIAGLESAIERMRNLSDGAVAEMGHSARHFVTEHFTAELYRERMLNLYALLGVRSTR